MPCVHNKLPLSKFHDILSDVADVVLDTASVTHTALKLITTPIVDIISSTSMNIIPAALDNPTTPAKLVNIDIYSAYLGRINVDAYDVGCGNFVLQSRVEGITVKCIDAIASAEPPLLPEQYEYSIEYLASLPATVVNIDQCRINHYAIMAQVFSPEQLSYNNSVDIYFINIQFIKFCKSKIHAAITKHDCLFSIHNTPIDNAFFTGEYMVYGNGYRTFTPLGTLDIGAHELGHGIVQSTAGLIYQDESGALNEGFADIIGMSFEFYMYSKYNSLLGVSDWTIGEDAVNMGLRDFINPHKSTPPQPKKYGGTHWAFGSADNGGVHINSGVLAHCFYLLTITTHISIVFELFILVLKSLPPNATYADFGRELQLKSIDFVDRIESEVHDVLRLTGILSYD